MGTLFCIVKIKSRFASKIGVLLDLKIRDVFSSRIREKGVFSKLRYERGIRFGWEGGFVGTAWN